jgi:Flp pilus assembly protein TadD
MDARRLAAGLSLLALTVLTGCGLPSFRAFNDPLSPQEHINLGVSYEESEEYDLARAEYEKAAEELPIANLYLGNVAWLTGDVEGARDAWEDAVDEAVSSQAMNNLAWLLYTEGKDLDRARKLAARAVAADPEEPGYRETLGMIEVRLREKDTVAETNERGGN